MNRRDFLRRALTGTAGLLAAQTLDLDRLLWVPGQRTYFDLWTPEEPLPEWFNAYTREMLRVFTNNLGIAQRINRSYDGPLGTGAIIAIRKPARYLA